MKPARVEAFTDGVVAIIITIVVLELRVPEGTGWAALAGTLPILAAYALAFVNVGLYWNNHHHLFSTVSRVDGRVLWANSFMLFWLSLVPFVIRWIDERGFASLPVAAYGFVLGMAAIGYTLTTAAILRLEGRDSRLATAIGRDRKGKASLALYAGAVPLAWLSPALAIALYVAVSAMWLVPDRRIEKGVGE